MVGPFGTLNMASIHMAVHKFSYEKTEGARCIPKPLTTTITLSILYQVIWSCMTRVLSHLSHQAFEVGLTIPILQMRLQKSQEFQKLTKLGSLLAMCSYLAFLISIELELFSDSNQPGNAERALEALFCVQKRKAWASFGLFLCLLCKLWCGHQRWPINFFEKMEMVILGPCLSFHKLESKNPEMC
jgi:hypothetical protein